MTPNLDPRSALHVARLPILNATGQVFGYELLYRGTTGSSAEPSSDVESARVLNDALLAIGLETLSSGRHLFVKLTRQLILSGFGTLLPVGPVVIEMNVNDVDVELLDSCRSLHSLGYPLALCGVRNDSAVDPLLPFAKYVAVDAQSVSREELEALRRRITPTIKLIAERVESIDTFDRVRAAGLNLFEGYFFCKPTTHSATPLFGQRMIYARLLAALNQPNVTTSELEELIKHDVSLAYRILRCINSAAFGMKREVHSIQHALVLLGLEQVRKWASVWALAGLNGNGRSELVTVALVRARTCELVAQRALGADVAGEYFLVGLCSLLDAMLDRPMNQALEGMPLSPVMRSALLGEQNPVRRVLDALVAYEHGEWDIVSNAAEAAGTSSEQVAAAYADALKWARELSQLATGAA